MIEWFERRDPQAPFLITRTRVWTYGELAGEIRRRIAPTTRVIRPRLDFGSLVEVMAGIASGGVLVTDGQFEEREPDLAGAALVVFTSGTTGSPRGVRLTTANLEAACRASVEHLGHGHEDIWLLAMPLTHVGGLSIPVRSAHAGGSVRLLPGFDPEQVGAAMEEGVTMMSLVPTMLRRLLDHRATASSSLRAVLLGGGPIPEGLLEEAAEAGFPVLPTYGMTETFGQVATLLPGSALGRHAHPLPGVDIDITPEGRIAIRSDQVSPGYLGQPDRVSEWFETPDLGEIMEDGSLRVLGRADDVIITGGVNVAPQEIEDVISVHPQVTEVAVVGIPDEEWGMAVAALYVGDIATGPLADWVGERLTGASMPKLLKRVGHIPKLSIGKPDRSAAAKLL